MLAEFLTSKFFFVIPMMMGALTFWWILRFFSIGTGITGDEAKRAIMAGNIAVAVYFGLRAGAVAIVVGLCILAGVIS